MLKSKVTAYLPHTSIPDTPQELDKYATEIVNAIRRATEETTPRKQPSPHSKRWWKPELTNLRKQVHKLRNKTRRSTTQNTMHAKSAWNRLNSKFLQEIAKAKTTKWREFVENTDNIWKAKRYLDNPTGVTTFVPVLEGHTTQDGKAKALQEAFFPHPPRANLKDIHLATYPQSVPFQMEITISQVQKAVNKLNPNKAPGPDEISNRILKNILPQIERHLQHLA